MRELGDGLLKARTALVDGRSADLENHLVDLDALARARTADLGWRVWRIDPALVWVIAQIVLAIVELIRQNRKLSRR